MFLNVIKMSYTEAYKLEVEFSDGAVKEMDLKDELYGEIFEPLKDIALFEQVFVNLETNTIEWPNGADFATLFTHDYQELTQDIVLVDIKSSFGLSWEPPLREPYSLVKLTPIFQARRLSAGVFEGL